ncbi:MAG: cyclohexanecarboxyl-CoA dehydrogenase [Gammaproteobacteria bacterium]|nr:MAG: cyclohexanecarboxyl-CoA dehydrogenase [Gammaproteobacteria bacterium]RLA53567.1 MAG: cyclohexanecarboxyl-CoA dehydrogenase [Gammaproteobacteria bacterium]
MHFGLSDFQHALIDSAKKFSAEKLAPLYKSREEEGIFSRELILEMGQLGFLAPEVDEKFGGSGLDALTSGLITEVIAAGDMNIAYVPINHSLLSSCIVKHARPEVVEEIIPKMCSGEILACIGLTEPRGGSDAANLILSAVRDGDSYILNGEKTSISMADQADINLVFARTGTREDRARGISAFIVDLNAEGITKSRFEDLGEKAVGRGSIFFDNVKIDARYRVGDEGKGFIQVMQGFDFSRALIGLQCLAVARKCLDETWQFIQDRETFGKPLAANQGITFPLAEAETQLEGARMVCLKALWLKSQGLDHTKEAAMAKWWAPKLAFDIAHQCLLIHGHGGYSEELPFAQRLRDVLGMQIGDGTAHIMKMVIARSYVGKI